MRFINVTFQWSETSLYNAGERRVKKIGWDYPTLPLKGDTVNVMKFIDNCPILKAGLFYQGDETFIYQNQSRTIFEWVQTEHFWMVEKRDWELEDIGIIPFLLITDKGYGM
jgi:hypothetical protein